MQNSQKINSQNKINDIIKMEKLTQDFFDKFIGKNIEIIPLNLYTKYNEQNIIKKKSDFGKNKYKENFNDKLDFKHKNFFCYAIRTGKINNITVIDIDTKDEEICNKVIEHLGMGCFGDFNTVVETKNGYHIYCKYNKLLPTGTQYKADFFNFKGIDIRNDGGIIYAPFSKYKDPDGTIKEYKLYGSNYELDDFIDDLVNYDNLFEVPEEFIDSPPVSPVKNITDYKPELKLELKEEKQIKNNNKKIDENINIEDIKKLLNKLNIERLDSYDNWIKIGMILFNISNGSLEYLNLFDEYSKKNNKYEEGKCMEKWMSFKNDNNGLSLGTLKLWVKEDNKDKDKEKEKNPNYNKYQDWYDDSIETFMENMNKELAYIEDIDEYIKIQKDSNIVRNPEKKIKPNYNHCKIIYKEIINGKEKEKKINPFQLWNDNILKKIYLRIVFDPALNSKDYFNLWKGFDIKKEDCINEPSCNIILNHIKDIWCKNNEIYYNYVLDWLAHIFQKPHQQSGVVLCLKSDEGSGKGVVLEILQKIIGRQHYETVNSMKYILGDFNGISEGKVLINLDEALWGGSKEDESKLKKLITDGTTQINKKNKECITMNNYSNYIISTNNDWFIGVKEGTRRFFCLECDDKYAGPSNKIKEEYFKKIRNVNINAFANFLYTRNIENFNVRDFPKTRLLQEQIEYNWDSVTRWWKKILDEDGFFENEEYYKFNESCILTKKYNEKIYYHKEKIFKNYKQNFNGYGKACNDGFFWKRLIKLTDCEIIRPRLDANARPRIILFNNITQLRENFNKIENWDYQYN